MRMAVEKNGFAVIAQTWKPAATIRTANPISWAVPLKSSVQHKRPVSTAATRRVTRKRTLATLREFR